MLRTHCTGLGTGQGQGPGPGAQSTVHIAVQGMVKGIQDTYGLVPDLVGEMGLEPIASQYHSRSLCSVYST